MRLMTALLVALLLSVSGAAMAQDNGARGNFVPDTSTPEPNGTADEGFDDITTLPGDGWALINNSSTIGTTEWFQGNDTVFPAHAGATTAYLAGNFNATGTDVINLWAVMPDLGYLQSVTFWTRTVTGSTFPDRLEVRHDPSGSTDVGSGSMDVGNFTTVLTEINPTLATGGYPEDWTEFTVAPLASGRVAFRYFVTDAGPAGNNSNYIGIDTLSWVVGAPIPQVIPALGTGGLLVLIALLGIGGALLVRRRQRA